MKGRVHGRLLSDIKGRVHGRLLSDIKRRVHGRLLSDIKGRVHGRLLSDVKTLKKSLYLCYMLWCVSVNRDKTVLQYKTVIALFKSTRHTTSGDRLQLRRVQMNCSITTKFSHFLPSKKTMYSKFTADKTIHSLSK